MKCYNYISILFLLDSETDKVLEKSGKSLNGYTVSEVHREHFDSYLIGESIRISIQVE